MCLSKFGDCVHAPSGTFIFTIYIKQQASPIFARCSEKVPTMKYQVFQSFEQFPGGQIVSAVLCPRWASLVWRMFSCWTPPCTARGSSGSGGTRRSDTQTDCCTNVLQCNGLQYSVTKYIILKYSVLEYSVLFYSVLQYFTPQYNVLQHCAMQYIVLYHFALQYNVIYHFALQYNVIYHFALQYNVIYHFALQYNVLYHFALQ